MGYYFQQTTVSGGNTGSNHSFYYSGPGGNHSVSAHTAASRTINIPNNPKGVSSSYFTGVAIRVTCSVTRRATSGDGGVWSGKSTYQVLINGANRASGSGRGTSNVDTGWISANLGANNTIAVRAPAITATEPGNSGTYTLNVSVGTITVYIRYTINWPTVTAGETKLTASLTNLFAQLYGTTQVAAGDTVQRTHWQNIGTIVGYTFASVGSVITKTQYDGLVAKCDNPDNYVSV